MAYLSLNFGDVEGDFEGVMNDNIAKSPSNL